MSLRCFTTLKTYWSKMLLCKVLASGGASTMQHISQIYFERTWIISSHFTITLFCVGLYIQSQLTFNILYMVKGIWILLQGNILPGGNNCKHVNTHTHFLAGQLLHPRCTPHQMRSFSLLLCRQGLRCIPDEMSEHRLTASRFVFMCTSTHSTAQEYASNISCLSLSGFACTWKVLVLLLVWNREGTWTGVFVHASEMRAAQGQSP